MPSGGLVGWAPEERRRQRRQMVVGPTSLGWMSSSNSLRKAADIIVAVSR